jgi:hypothetical protein
MRTVPHTGCRSGVCFKPAAATKCRQLKQPGVSYGRVHLSYIRGCALLTTTRNASPEGLQLSDSTGWPSEGVKSLQEHSGQARTASRASALLAWVVQTRCGRLSLCCQWWRRHYDAHAYACCSPRPAPPGC